MKLDNDLQSIQEVRDLIEQGKKAQEIFSCYSQKQVDSLLTILVEACEENNERLAKMAVSETGFGKWEDKVLKNRLGSSMTLESIKNMKTIGILMEDSEKGMMEVAVPIGIIAALIPSTNPTSTTMYKSLIALKAGNAIIFSPHPNAKESIMETVKILQQAAAFANAPEGLIQCISRATMQATDALLKHKDIGMILATGGEAMVRAAYSSGNPAIGVGPGNGPAFIEKSADIKKAVRHIIESKTFDNGTICASEQSVIVESCIAQDVKEELIRQEAYFLNNTESEKLGKFILRENGTMNPKIVGKSAVEIAHLAGITVSSSIQVLISHEETVSKKNPYSREKLCPILAFYVEDTWKEACARSMEILFSEGAGHTMTIHSNDREIINEFARKKPVSRLLVNTPAALGGVGVTSNLAPALTLGCGAIGGSSTSDNVTPLNLFNIRRIAWGKKELIDLKEEISHTSSVGKTQDLKAEQYSEKEIETIAREVLKKLQSV